MTDSDADPVQLRRQLVENYHKLSPLEQVIVQLFSVIYEPVSGQGPQCHPLLVEIVTRDAVQGGY